MSKDKSFYSVKSNENKTANATIKDVSTSSRVVTGFYNSYNFFDSTNDVLLPGCAKRSIKNSGPSSDATAKIKHALNHDLTTLPGKIITLDEREVNGIEGIYFETQMADTTLGNDTLKNYLEGIYDNHSIGFRYVQLSMIEKIAHGNNKQWEALMADLINPDAVGDAQVMYAVKEIQLFEGSTVAFGANSLTPYLGVKSGNKDSYLLMLVDRINKFEKTLK